MLNSLYLLLYHGDLMEFSKLFKDSLKYPTQNLHALIVFGIFFLLANLTSFYYKFTGKLDIGTVFILQIIALVVWFFISGYLLSIIKSTVEGLDDVPDISLKNDAVVGIKSLVIVVVYSLLPGLIIGFILSGFGLIGFGDVSAIDIENIHGSLSHAVTTTGILSVVIGALVSMVVLLIFSSLLLMAECSLALTGKIKTGLNFKKAWKEVSAIGWGTFIIWDIILFLIVAILALISSLITQIPIVGIFIEYIIISPFIAMFVARATGLMHLCE